MRELALDPIRQDHIDETLGWVVRGEKFRQIAARCRDGGDGWSSFGQRFLPRFGPLSQLFSQPGVPLLLFRRRELHRQIVKAIGVPFCVALDETDELLGGSHD